MESQSFSVLANLFPFILMGIILGSFTIPIAKRKGKNPIASFFLCFIPIFNMFWLIYLASLCDIEIKETINKLKEKIGEIK